MIESEYIIKKEDLRQFGLNDFFTKTFEQFKAELNRLHDTIYNYNDHKLLFALNERAWLGVFNNAIINAFPESAVTLQEFSVYNEGKFVGRADFLVHWKAGNGKEFYLLFEAKQYEETSRSKILNDTWDDLNKIKLQAQKYFDAEISYYEGKTVYIIPIAFGWIKKEGFLDEAKKYFLKGQQKDQTSDFCALFYENEVGMWIYGKIFEPK